MPSCCLAPHDYIFLLSLVLLCDLVSKCSGFTLTSEDSSEVAFLLVENYNYDCSSWPSGRLGIFEPNSVRCVLFVDCCGLRYKIEEEISHCLDMVLIDASHGSGMGDCWQVRLTHRTPLCDAQVPNRRMV